MPTICRKCGDPFEQPIEGYFLSRCPKCWKKYLKSEPKAKEDKKQAKLI